MADEFVSGIPDIVIKVRDLEERQRLMRDKVDLLSKNFINLKETLEKEVSMLKIDIEQLKKEVDKIKSLILRISEEIDNKAKKSDLEIIAKQLKMLQPFIK
ncbi:MAG: hypothetical protein QXF25_02225 [Candidatus Pacearchaeota archaeon]